MLKRGKVVNAQKQKRETIEKGDVQKDIARPIAKARAWATMQKLPSGGEKMDARRKLPSGPLGGSGRKTNVSRSS
jgi:hypothetical protein